MTSDKTPETEQCRCAHKREEWSKFTASPPESLVDLVLGNDDGDLGEPPHWKKIAEEVLWRKRLLLAAAHELQMRHVPNAFQLATVDVFVEKAQRQLTDRATAFLRAGILSGAAAVMFMLAGCVLFSDSGGHFLQALADAVAAPLHAQWLATTVSQILAIAGHSSTAPGTNPSDIVSVVLNVLRLTTVSGFFIGAVVFLVFMSRASLHEMVVIYQRRHALRFGRLAVYLRPELTTKELEMAFNWNAEYRSAFMDIKADKILQPLLGKVIDTMKDVAVGVGSAAVRGAAKAKIEEERDA